MKTCIRKKSYVDQFKEKYADEFEKDSLENRLRLEKRVDDEVKRLYAEFEAHKRLRDLKNVQQPTRATQSTARRPVSRLLKSKFSNPKPSSSSSSFYFVAPGRLDSIQNGCNQMKEKQNLLKKRIEYGKKVTEANANVKRNKQCGKSLPVAAGRGDQPGENKNAVPAKFKSGIQHPNKFMDERLAKGNNNSHWDSKMLPTPPLPALPTSPMRSNGGGTISKEHCCNNKILMRNPQFMTESKQQQTKKKQDNRFGNNRGSIEYHHHHHHHHCTKSTGSSPDYFYNKDKKCDESKLEEMRMRHEIGMQYVNKLIEEMKL